MKEVLKSNRGATLPEMLVTVLIFSFVLLGVYQTTSIGEASYRINSSKVRLQQDLRKAMEWMHYELREAGPSSISNVPADGAWYNQISFKVPNGITSGNIVWDSSFIQFALGGVNANQLQRSYGGSTKILAQNVKTLNFRRQSSNPDIVEVDLVGEETTTKNETVDYQLSFKIQLRNP